MSMKRVVLIVVAVMVLSSLAFGLEWWEEEAARVTSAVVKVERTTKYESIVNFEDGYIQVSAFATADIKEAVNYTHAESMATKTARVLAYEQLAEEIDGLALTADTTVENELLKHSLVQTHVEAFIKGARVIDTKSEMMDDGSPKVTVTVGRLLNLPHPGPTAPPPPAEVPAEPVALTQVLQPVAAAADQETPTPAYVAPAEIPPAEPTPAAPPTPQVPAAQLTEFDPSVMYTGLIVDCRGLGGLAAMSPKILTEDGKEVWGTVQCSAEFAISYGIAGWVHNMEKAHMSARCGDQPLIVKATGVEGPFKCNFVVSDRTAAIIKKAAENSNFLKMCNVIFVT